MSDKRSFQELELMLDEGGDEAAEALKDLSERVRAGVIARGPSSPSDIHIHTNRSYNPEHWSPERTVWQGWIKRAPVVGTVDFDTLSSVQPAWNAGLMLGQKVVASFETRIYLPEFAHKTINSPGEPGVCYIMVTGCKEPGVEAKAVLDRVGLVAHRRNDAVLRSLLGYLDLGQLVHYEQVIQRTVSGMPTDRHVIAAVMDAVTERYALDEESELIRYWAGKLHTDVEAAIEQGKLGDMIRKLTKPDGEAALEFDATNFATLTDVSALADSVGGILTGAVLDGTTEFEVDVEKMFEYFTNMGVEALNFIYWRMPRSTEGLAWANSVMDVACARNWPTFGGSEMNSPGQKPFGRPDFTSYYPQFERGALALYGQSLLARANNWRWMNVGVTRQFGLDIAEALAFYVSVGRKFNPQLHPVEELGRVACDTNSCQSVIDYLDSTLPES